MPNAQKKQRNRNTRKATSSTTVTKNVRRQTRSAPRQPNPGKPLPFVSPRLRVHVEPFTDFVGTVSSSTPFSATKYIIDPSNIITFPITSQIGELFEKFRFRSFQIKLVPKVSSFKSSGTLAMAWDPDMTDAPLKSMAEVLNSEYHTDAMPDKPQHLTLPRQVEWAWAPGYGLDVEKRRENFGAIYIATSGNDTSAPVLADVFVTGVVELTFRHQPHQTQDAIVAGVTFPVGQENPEHRPLVLTDPVESSLSVVETPFPSADKTPMSTVVFNKPGFYLVNGTVSASNYMSDGSGTYPQLKLYNAEGKDVNWDTRFSENSGNRDHYTYTIKITQDMILRYANKLLMWWIGTGASAGMIATGYIAVQRLTNAAQVPALAAAEASS